MERLTKRINEVAIELTSDIQRAISKLAYYEDLAESGRLVELPCKVGETVYIPYISTVIEKKVYSIVVQNSFYTIYCGGTSLRFSGEDFGKTVFLTREEAEAALKDRT